MNKNLFDRFMSGEVAVHVSTKEQCAKFMEFLEDNTDKIWSTGEKPTELNYWSIYGTDTVIYGGDIYGDDIYSANRLTFGDMQNDADYGYTVVEFEDLMKDGEN